MRKILRISTVLFVAVMRFSCGSSTQTITDPEAESGVELLLIDPYADSQEYDENPFEGFPVVTGLSIPSNVNAEEIVSEESSYSAEEELQEEIPIEIPETSHYSVQVTAATEESSAERIAAILESDTDYPVFIDRVNQYWKVRVGAFEERGDAEACCNSLINLGYADAWVTTREP